MARWSASTAATVAAVVGASLLYSMALMTTASAQQPGPGNMQVINLDGRRNSKFTCTDTNKNSKRPGCTATCPARCPKKCLVLCPTCKTFCRKYYSYCASSSFSFSHACNSIPLSSYTFQPV